MMCTGITSVPVLKENLHTELLPCSARPCLPVMRVVFPHSNRPLCPAAAPNGRSGGSHQPSPLRPQMSPAGSTSLTIDPYEDPTQVPFSI